MASNSKNANEEEEEDEIKVILVGESGTGKTSLINSVQGGSVEGNQMSTITCSFITMQKTIDGEEYNINLWDTIGQEQFRSLTKIFLNNSKIVIFVFDITDKASFEAIDYWINTIEQELGQEPIKGIAANKQDLFDDQEVDEDLIKAYSNKKGITYSYTTATNKETFNTFLEILLKKYIEKVGIKNIKKTKKKGKKLEIKGKRKKEKKKCC